MTIFCDYRKKCETCFIVTSCLQITVFSNKELYDEIVKLS